MKKKILSLFVHGQLILMSLIVLVPIFLIVMSSFNAGNGIAAKSLLPSQFTIDNYVNLLTNTAYPLWFFNTLKIATASTILSVFLVMVTAWIMSRFSFKGKKTSLMTILILSMFPSFLSMTAIYTLFLVLGLTGNSLSLIIIYSAGAIPFNTWLVKGYLDGISKSIDEASYIDGCGRFQSFFKIVLPVARPIITYCAIAGFMMPWMDYILPNILLSGNKSKTLAVGLYSMISSNETAQFTLFAAGSVLIAIPITLIFVFFQKYLVTGIAAGASKE